MNFFKDQFNNLFSQKNDSHVASNKDNEEGNSIIAGEGQDPNDIDLDLDIQDAQLAEF